MSFFDGSTLDTVERIILSEEIKLPELPDYPLTLDNLEKYGEYKLAEREYKDITAKFILKLATPLLDQTSNTETTKSSPSSRKQSNLNTSSYTTTNYIQLTIPKYIVMQFTGTIPKGTEFLIACVGGSLELEDMRIIGFYK
jgi:hypothetical protein